MRSRTPHRRRPAGFTLIELLVSVGIVSVVTGAIGATLYGGIRVWERSRDFTTTEAAIFPGLSLLERDLMNVGLVIEELPFEGTAATVAFAALLDKPDPLAEGPPFQLGRVKYIYDGRRKLLLRKSWRHPDNEPPGDLVAERILSNLRRFEFRYLDAEDMEEGESWQTTWESTTNSPVGIRIYLQGGTESRPFEVTRTLVLPAQRVAEEDEE